MNLHDCGEIAQVVQAVFFAPSAVILMVLLGRHYKAMREAQSAAIGEKEATIERLRQELEAALAKDLLETKSKLLQLADQLLVRKSEELERLQGALEPSGEEFAALSSAMDGLRDASEEIRAHHASLGELLERAFPDLDLSPEEEL